MKCQFCDLETDEIVYRAKDLLPQMYICRHCSVGYYVGDEVEKPVVMFVMRKERLE